VSFNLIVRSSTPICAFMGLQSHTNLPCLVNLALHVFMTVISIVTHILTMVLVVFDSLLANVPVN